MDRIRTLVIDQDNDSRSWICKQIEKNVPDLEVLADTGDVVSAVDAVRAFAPELILLDIEMLIRAVFSVIDDFMMPKFEVIFMTDKANFMLPALGLEPRDYLVKPFTKEGVVEAVERYKLRRIAKFRRYPLLRPAHQRKGEFGKVILPTTSGFSFINIEEITRCQSSGSYTVIFLADGRQVVSTRNLKKFENQFGDFFFHRIHHQNLVNLHFVQDIDVKLNQVVMKDGSELPISQRKRAGLIELMKRLATFRTY